MATAAATGQVRTGDRRPTALLNRPRSLAKAVNSRSSGRLTVANAHAVFAWCCAVNSLTRRSAAVSKAVEGGGERGRSFKRVNKGLKSF